MSPGTESSATSHLEPEALARASRVSRRGALYVAEHRLRAMRRYGWTIVLGGVGSPLVYLLGLGLGLATLIHTAIETSADGEPVRYVVFVGPALLVTAAVEVATGEFTYSVMSGFTWDKTFFGMASAPLRPGQIAGGLVIAVAARMLFVTAAYTGLLLLFGAVEPAWSDLLLPFVGVLAGLAFGMPLLAYAATLTRDGGQFAIVQRFIFTPLFLFSGTFFPLSTLPLGLQWIGWISPLWHGSELGRALSYGAAVPAWLTAVHVAYLAALALGGWLGARRVFARRLDQ